MDVRRQAYAYAVLRGALGAALALTPRLAARGWVGRGAATAPTQVVSVGFGARDVGLALGAGQALRAGGDVRPWILAAVLADAADLAATLRWRHELPPLGVAGVGLMAAGGTAFGLWLQRALAQPSP